MKIIGLLGGMSWESTKTYYQHLNVMAKQRLGGLHSAKIVLSSVDFGVLETRMRAEDWAGISGLLVQEAERLQSAGIDCLLLCTNTMHKLYDDIAAKTNVPFFHIADVLGQQLRTDGITHAGLLGTRFTMQQNFYVQRLQPFGVRVVLPTPEQQQKMDAIIFDELCKGIVTETSQQCQQQVIDDLAQRGAQAVALACTELEMLITTQKNCLPLYDTTWLHAHHASEWALS